MKKILLSTLVLMLSVSIFAQTDLFFSEYVEGGGNNKALEIYNPTDQTISLSDYQMSRYSNGGTNPNYVQFPGGAEIASHDVYVVVLDKRDPEGTGNDTMVAVELQDMADAFLCPVYNVNKMMYFNGNDAVTLEKISNGAVVDIFGVVGQDPGEGWYDGAETDYMTNNFWEAWTRDHTLIRKPEIITGVIQNPNVFNPAVQWDSLPKDTFDHLQYHQSVLGTQEVFVQKRFILYPNPTGNKTITIQGNDNISEVQVFSLIGKKELEYKVDEITAKLVLDLNDLSCGIYLVKAKYTNGSTFTQKMRIQ
jgi:hypothetical protein